MIMENRDRGILGREQVLVALLGLTLPFVVFSGLMTWPFAQDHWYWLQALFITHAAVGVIAAVAMVPYTAIHFFRTFGNRVFPVFFSGLLAGTVMLIAIGSGLWLVVMGQTEQTRWVLPVHVYSSLALCAIVAYHVVHHVRRARRKRRAPRATVPSLLALRTRPPVLAFVVQVGLTLTIWAVAHALDPGALAVEAPTDYGYPYGEHAMAPSETEIRGGDLLSPVVLGRSGDCARCHRELHDQWKSSVHAKAALDPAYERNVTLLAKKKGIEATRYCEGCHAPVAMLGGHLKKGGKHAGVEGTLANREGVSCVACHTVSDVLHTKGVASYKVAAPAPYVFEYDSPAWMQAVSDWLTRMRPELHRKNFDTGRISGPEFCATCHSQYMDERMNDWGWVQMQDQYSSWLESPYSGRSDQTFASTRKRICRDCHMDRAPAHDPSRSSEGTIHSHWFPGGNTFVPSETGDPEHLERVRRFLMTDKLRIAVHLEDNRSMERSDRHVDENLRRGGEVPDYYYLGQQVQGVILVSNVGVGHKFPAGTNDIHEAWVSVEVVDALNRRIHQEGALREDGTLDEASHVYRSVKVDRHGRHVWKHDLFNMVGERYSNVIPSGETDVVPVSFRIPSWAVSPLVVSARLNYRKFNKRYGAWVMRNPDYVSPVTVMADHSLRIDVVERPGTDSES